MQKSLPGLECDVSQLTKYKKDTIRRQAESLAAWIRGVINYLLCLRKYNLEFAQLFIMQHVQTNIVISAQKFLFKLLHFGNVR